MRKMTFFHALSYLFFSRFDMSLFFTLCHVLTIVSKKVTFLMSDYFYSDSDSEIQIYVVEAIVGKKYQDGVPMYQVRWKGYDENTWEPLENLENCDDILRDFENSEIAARADEEEKQRLRLLRENTKQKPETQKIN